MRSKIKAMLPKKPEMMTKTWRAGEQSGRIDLLEAKKKRVAVGT
jgi:hypothetical protein